MISLLCFNTDKTRFLPNKSNIPVSKNLDFASSDQILSNSQDDAQENLDECLST